MTSARTLVALAAVVILARAAGWLLTRARQPAVIGELLVGIVLGPTLLSGRLGRAVIPAATRSELSLLGTLGVILLTLLVALRLAPENRREVGKAGQIATGSMLVPLAAGSAVGALLAGRYRPPGVGELAFVLFVGAATAITAFPVLARILAERGWETLPIGRLALTTSAIGDLVTWLLLTAVLALAGAQGAHPGRLLWLIPYVAVLILLRVGGEPLWRRLTSPSVVLAVLVAGAVASASLTDWIGLQTIIGAFAFGLAVPRQQAQTVLKQAVPGIEPMVVFVLMPVYFVLSGLKVDLAHIGGAGVAALGLIALAAIGGKAVGVITPARLQGMSWRNSLTLAALLDTRGLTEIVVLTVGLQDHIIGTQLFSLMIAMAVGTTLLTGPLISRLGLGPESPPPDPPAPAPVNPAPRPPIRSDAAGPLVP